jgi:hypothetical protein
MKSTNLRETMKINIMHPRCNDPKCPCSITDKELEKIRFMVQQMTKKFGSLMNESIFEKFINRDKLAAIITNTLANVNRIIITIAFEDEESQSYINQLFANIYELTLRGNLEDIILGEKK